MRHGWRTFLAAVAMCGAVQAAEPLKVTTDENNVISVNGKKFLPIAVWLQPEDTFGMWKGMGMNLFVASSNPRREGNVASYLKAAKDGARTVELKPWETVVLVVDRAE